MSKKIFSVSIILSLLFALIASSSAFAQTSTTTTRYDNRYGKVTAVSTGSITITNLFNKSKTILVTNTTKYYGTAGVVKSLNDVTTGAWIFASGTVDSSKNLVANVVILVGTKFTSKAYWDFTREYGTVISVDPAHGVFFMNTAKSGLVKVIAYDGTVFLNKKVKSVSAISVGMKAVVAGPVQSNGFILPRIVIAFKPSRR